MKPKQNMAKFIIFSTIKSIIFALLITVVFGYVLGFRATLVNGWSAQPDIKYQSLIITQKVKAESLEIGDYIQFSKSGTSLVTHQIIDVDRENNIFITSDNQYNSETGEYEHKNAEPVA